MQASFHTVHKITWLVRIRLGRLVPRVARWPVFWYNHRL